MTGPAGFPVERVRPGDGFHMGVDVGTSHTVAMLRWSDGRTRPLLFDGQPLLPSAVFLDASGRLQVGRDALRLGYAEPGRFEPNPKRHIDADSVLLGGSSVPVADLLAALLGAVAREAVATIGFLPPAVVTCPAAWGARRRAVLTEAIGKAGWPRETQLLPEPVAAARYFADVLRRPVPVGSALAVFDFGGGTLDVAVVRNEGFGPDGRPVFEVAASGGVDDLGGLDLDAALVDHLGKSLAGGEPEAWATLTEPSTLAQWRARRQFWDDVRGAKEMLSRSALSPVPVPGVEHAVHLTRDELEAAAAPLIRRGVTEAGAVIKAAGLTPDDLAGLFLVGGSTRVPLVARLLHSELGIAPTVLEQPELPVAEGAIVAATSTAAPPPRAEEAPAVVAGLPPRAEKAPAAVAAPPRAEEAPAPVAASPAGGGAAAATGDMTATAAHAGPDDPAASTSMPGQAAGPAPRTADAEVQYQRGLSAAATPPPTADTVPNQPPPRPDPAPAGPAPEYAQPVDPWATGEAAAFAASGGSPIFPGSGAPTGHTMAPPAHEPWLASTQPDPPDATPKGRPGGYRKKVLILAAAAVVVVLGVGATLAVIFWPGYPAVDFKPLAAPHRLTPSVPVSSGFADAALIQNRAYFAGVSDKGLIGVFAAAADTGEKLWESSKAGTAERWERMIALPDGVALVSDADLTTGKKRLVLLGADKGDKLWERAIDRYDDLLFIDDVVVLVDRTQHRLLGLEINKKGHARWEQPDIKTNSGTSTSVFAATTKDDLSGPASVTGAAFVPDMDDDKRIVQISADRSARVIDAESGKIRVPPRQAVADTGDQVVVHNGRLIVQETGTGDRVVAYDLDKLGEPTSLYTLPENTRVTDLTPCGDDRVCWIEETGYQTEQRQVAGVNAADGSGLWHRAVPNVETLVPVGDSVLARSSLPGEKVSLLDAKGKISWTRGGVAARLDGGNILLFSKALSTSLDDPSLAGRHLGDDEKQLGPLADVRSATCAWNTSTIACVADEDFMLQRFAD